MTGTNHQQLVDRVSEMMDRAWRDPGFCVPNQDTYPHQWLWDSCFHAMIWAELGSDRGVTEVQHALANQAADGFVPHMTYWNAPDLHADYWGRSGISTITQPPMYGHAIVGLALADLAVPPSLVEQAVNGLLHLARRPRTPGNLIPVFHPWETGCDDSARWDAWLPVDAVMSPDGPAAAALPANGERRQAAWRAEKTRLVGTLIRSDEGHAVGNAAFAVGSVGFNALVSFNARELAAINGPWADALHDLADELDDAVAARWDGRTWRDDGGPPDGQATSGAIRTLDGLLPLLVDPRAAAFADLVHPDGFGAPFGPRGAHADEPSYDPARYWRGPSWPQLSYLLMIAAERAGEDVITAEVAASLVAGAETSGLAEFWNPETGAGAGAIPQTWAGLAVCALRRLA
ncbi:MAG: hypothetical protein AAF531_09045 [Actinomycetota bacterium]